MMLAELVLLPADRVAIAGVAFALLAFAYFYLCGSILRAPRLAPDWEPSALNSGAALLDVVIVTASGMAIVGFFTFAAGLAHAIYPAALIVLPVALGALAAALGDNPLKRAFWSRRGTVLRRAVSPGALLVLAGCIMVSYPAILPDPGSDATVYHHVYAFDWATAHRLYVDAWIRGPLYANDWLLLVTWAYALHADAYILFLNWLTGALTLIGVYGYVVSRVQSGDDSRPTIRDAALGIAAVLTVALTPQFLEYWNLSIVDIPIGFFFFAFAAASVVAIGRRARYSIADVIISGGFLVGMKVSFIALLPLVVIAAGLAARATGLPRRGALLAAVFATATSAPWYVRNFLIAGDPISPVLNLRFHGADKYISLADYSGLVGSIYTAHTLAEVLRVPLELFWRPDVLQGVGMSMIILLLWAPALVVAYAIVRNRPVTRFVPALAGSILLYAYAYWMLTSNFERYALLFVPFFCAFVASLLTLPGRRLPAIKWLGAAALLALALPSPSAWAQIQTFRQNNYDLVRASFDGNRDSWLETHTHGYRDIEYIARVMHASRRPGLRVYRLNLEIDTLFYKQKGVDSIGEWSGPERYHDFAYALDRNDMRAYLERLNIGVIIIPPPEVGMVLSVDQLDQLAEEMAALKFRRVMLPKSGFIMYFSPEIGPLPPVPAAGP
jgi:hypothetical protein